MHREPRSHTQSPIELAILFPFFFSFLSFPFPNKLLAGYIDHRITLLLSSSQIAILQADQTRQDRVDASLPNK